MQACATRSIRRLGLILAVLAVMVKLVIPPGFMPSASGAGLAICTTHAGLPGDGQGDTGDQPLRHGLACPFAAAVASAPPPALVLVAVPVAWALRPLPAPRRAAAFTPDPARLSPPGQGPPSAPV